MDIFLGVISYLFLCFVASEIAGRKGRSQVGFFFLALLLSPLIGLIAALSAGKNVENIEKEMIEEGEAKRCPLCAELIKPEARVFRFCGRDLPDNDQGRSPA